MQQNVMHQDADTAMHRYSNPSMRQSAASGRRILKKTAEKAKKTAV